MFEAVGGWVAGASGQMLLVAGVGALLLLLVLFAFARVSPVAFVLVGVAIGAAQVVVVERRLPNGQDVRPLVIVLLILIFFAGAAKATKRK